MLSLDSNPDIDEKTFQDYHAFLNVDSDIEDIINEEHKESSSNFGSKKSLELSKSFKNKSPHKSPHKSSAQVSAQVPGDHPHKSPHKSSKNSAHKSNRSCAHGVSNKIRPPWFTRVMGVIDYVYSCIIIIL